MITTRNPKILRIRLKNSLNRKVKWLSSQIDQFKFNNYQIDHLSTAKWITDNQIHNSATQSNQVKSYQQFNNAIETDRTNI